MRRKIAAGNWKMNTTVHEGVDLIRTLSSHKIPSEVEMIICAPFTHISELLNASAGFISIGAQNMFYEDKGAFTGEISPLMLKSMKVEYVLIGHSERREYFSESNEVLVKKINKALEHDLKPIFCCGEPLGVRKSGSHIDHVQRQLDEGLFHLSSEAMKNVILAYEPIWAIGTGETASPEQAQEMHKAIREMVRFKYSDALAEGFPILYGGSVKATNATTLFSQKDVDGGLVGGASLDATGFVEIANSF